jgi:hypothetical protein
MNSFSFRPHSADHSTDNLIVVSSCPLKILCIVGCCFFVDYGPAIIEHALLKARFSAGCKLGKGFDLVKNTPELFAALSEADRLLDWASQQESKVSHKVDFVQY